MFILLYMPPCGEWYVHSHKLYTSVEQARDKAAKFLTPGTRIRIVELDALAGDEFTV